MSKKLFFVLLAANFILFSWEVGRDRKLPAVTAQGMEQVDRLLLLDELDDLPKKPPPLATRILPDRKSGNTSTKDSGTEEHAQHEEAAEVITLAEGMAGDMPDHPVFVPSETIHQSASRPCYRIGPFAERAQIDTFLARLEGTGIGGRIETTTVSLTSGYWIMTPTFASLADAEATVQRLKSKGFQDVWLFDRGPMKGVISLGLYSKKSRAEMVASRFRQQGVVVDVSPKKDSREELWIRFESEPPSDLLTGAPLPLQLQACDLQSDSVERTSVDDPEEGMGVTDKE